MNYPLEIIIAAAVTFFIVQTIKLTTDRIKGNFTVKGILTSYGGMPSSHAALVTAVTSMVAYREGVDSAVFAVALVFSLIVITDALVLRLHINNQGRSIQQLINKLPDKERSAFPKIRLGLQHTLPQVLVGIFIGFSIASIVQLLA
ncbi:MAG: divergent PAP2 family protein [Patescibacteria group bacterium]